MAEDSNIFDHMFFSKTHEWILVDKNIITVGISEYARDAIGDSIACFDPPEIGDALEKGDPSGVIETVKAASEVYTPVAGVIQGFNGELDNYPEKIYEDCYGSGWLFKIKIPEVPLDTSDMMDYAAYKNYIKGL